ncbi:MAG: hypothetical protein B5M55_08350 [Desulfococcus sp. 4484_242]|nr:MAG: hypothetical protein B5M55_08350 [Desulfococcus sp. 4484_242]
MFRIFLTTKMMNENKSVKNFQAKTLANAGRHPVLPFIMPLEEHTASVCCKELLRIVPGKRAVLLSEWGERQVIAKVFFRPFRFRQHIRQELEGVQALKKAGISTPDLLYEGTAENSSVGVLLFEYVHPAVDLIKFCGRSDNHNERDDVLRRLMRLLAGMHERGLIQNDLHLKNFLLKGQTIYCIDGASVSADRSGRSVRIPDSLNNLASLLCLMDFQDRSLVRDLFAAYAEARQWRKIDPLFGQLKHCIERKLKHRMKKKGRKVFRNTSELICRKSFFRVVLCRRVKYSPGMAAFLDNPDHVLEEASSRMIKSGHSSTVARLEIDDMDLVVKRYNIKGFRHGVRRSVKNTRAANSWKNAWMLSMLGIATPAPVALVECRFGPFRGRSYFICEYVDGPCVIDFFSRADFNGKQSVARQITDLFKNLRRAKISHGDMKGTNILVKDQKPVLVDLDAMRVHWNSRHFISACEKDKDRFLKNWLNTPDVIRLFDDLQSLETTS